MLRRIARKEAKSVIMFRVRMFSNLIKAEAQLGRWITLGSINGFLDPGIVHRSIIPIHLGEVQVDGSNPQLAGSDTAYPTRTAACPYLLPT